VWGVARAAQPQKSRAAHAFAASAQRRVIPHPNPPPQGGSDLSGAVACQTLGSLPPLPSPAAARDSSVCSSRAPSSVCGCCRNTPTSLAIRGDPSTPRRLELNARARWLDDFTSCRTHKASVLGVQFRHRGAGPALRLHASDRALQVLA